MPPQTLLHSAPVELGNPSNAGANDRQFTSQLLANLAKAPLPESEKLRILVKVPDLNEKRLRELEEFLCAKGGRKAGTGPGEEESGGERRRARIKVLKEIALDHRVHGDCLDAEGFPSPRGLIRYSDRRVVGQAQAKEEVAIAFYYHSLSLRDPELAGVARTFAGPVMGIGPTGAGKTLLFKTFADATGLPFHPVNCAALVSEGIVGESLGSSLLGHLERHGGDPEKVRGTVLFFDEVDKLFTKAGPYGEPVGSQLLCLLEGGEVALHRKGDWNPINLATNTFLVTMTGAFQGLHERVAGPREVLGFHAGVDGVGQGSVTGHDLAREGVPRELLGRCRTITHFAPLGVEDLLAILLMQNDRGPIHAVERLLGGRPLGLSDSDLRKLAEEAGAAGTGARGLYQRVRKLAKERLLRGMVA